MRLMKCTAHKRSSNGEEQGSQKVMRLTKCTAQKRSLDSDQEGSQKLMPQKRSSKTEEKRNQKIKRAKTSEGDVKKAEETKKKPTSLDQEIELTRKLLELEKDRGGKNEKLVSTLLSRFCREDELKDSVSRQNSRKKKTNFQPFKMVGGFKRIYCGVWSHVNSVPKRPKALIIFKLSGLKRSLNTDVEGTDKKLMPQKRSSNTEEEGSQKVKGTKKTKTEWFLDQERELVKKIYDLELHRRGKNEKFVLKVLRQIWGEDVVYHEMKSYVSSSRRALQNYNRKMKTNFLFVKVLGGFKKIWRGVWIHINFVAKRKGHDSQKIFFAELNGGIPWRVTQCCILKSGATLGCGFCDPTGTVRHPAVFRMGRYPYSRPFSLSLNSPFTEEQYDCLMKSMF